MRSHRDAQDAFTLYVPHSVHVSHYYFLQVLPGDQLQKGFGRLVESLDDLLLDVPDAVELLSLFIARGVVRTGSFMFAWWIQQPCLYCWAQRTMFDNCQAAYTVGHSKQYC